MKACPRKLDMHIAPWLPLYIPTPVWVNKHGATWHGVAACVVGIYYAMWESGWIGMVQ